MYWAYDDSITEETDPNCAKWFSINGTRHPVAECKVPDVQVDGLSVFQFNTNYGSTSVAAVDSEGVSSPAVASGQAVPPATYVIKYDGNGADGGTAPDSQNKTQYTDITLATNSGGLTRIGFRFSGWNTAPDGNGTTYSAGATYSADAGVTLYAKWEVVNTVTFSKSGAVDHGDSVTLTPPAGATIYYRVQGKDEQQGAQGQFVTIKLYNETNMPPSPTGVDIGIPESGSVTITAYAKYADGTQSSETTGIYSLKQYTVSYVGNGNTGGTVPSQDTFYSGGSVTIQSGNGLTKTGHTFTAWKGNDGQSYSPNSTYSTDSDLTLYAQWKITKVTVDASQISSADLRTKLAEYSDCEITVDLGGNTLSVTNTDFTSNKDFFTIKNGNKVTITNGTISVSGDFSSATADDNFSLFSVTTGSTLTLSDCTLTGSDFQNAGGTAVKVNGGSVTLTDTTISNFNSNSSRAGVYVIGGTVTMAGNSYIKDNEARYGAAVRCNGNGTFIMNGGEISGNSNVFGSTISGDGTFEWNGGTISGNTNGSSEGGGVFARNIVYRGSKDRGDVLP